MTPRSSDLLAPITGDARWLIDRALAFGRRHDVEIYLVGGAVRDLLLGEEIKDLDLVWEGPGEVENTARAFGHALGCKVEYHPDFLTASLSRDIVPGVDLARARSESYSAPAILPTVAPAQLRQDLMRRDFTVNAMAVHLERPRELIDPSGGAADLTERLLKSIHQESFRDDPTRILRGCELAERRGFDFDDATRSSIADAVAVGLLGLLSGTRVRRELERLFGDRSRARATATRLKALEVDRALHSAFRVEAPGLDRLSRLVPWPAPPEGAELQNWPAFWIVAVMALLWDETVASRCEVSRWLGVGGSEKGWLERTPERLGVLLELLASADREVESSSEAMLTLYSQLSAAEIRALELLGSPAKAGVLEQLRLLSGIKLQIGGKDLLATGAAAGAGIGEALSATLAARRRGEIEAAQELEFAVSCLRTRKLGDVPS